MVLEPGDELSTTCHARQLGDTVRRPSTWPSGALSSSICPGSGGGGPSGPRRADVAGAPIRGGGVPWLGPPFSWDGLCDRSSRSPGEPRGQSPAGDNAQSTCPPRGLRVAWAGSPPKPLTAVLDQRSASFGTGRVAEAGQHIQEAVKAGGPARGGGVLQSPMRGQLAGGGFALSTGPHLVCLRKTELRDRQTDKGRN